MVGAAVVGSLVVGACVVGAFVFGSGVNSWLSWSLSLVVDVTSISGGSVASSVVVVVVDSIVGFGDSVGGFVGELVGLGVLQYYHDCMHNAECISIVYLFGGFVTFSGVGRDVRSGLVGRGVLT